MKRGGKEHPKKHTPRKSFYPPLTQPSQLGFGKGAKALSGNSTHTARYGGAS